MGSLASGTADVSRRARTHPEVERPFRVPGGTVGLWVCSALSLAWTITALALLLWPPELPAAFHDDRATFQLTQVVPLALLVACGLAFASLGRARPAAEHRAALTRE